jgi:Ino eighty subunit 1
MHAAPASPQGRISRAYRPSANAPVSLKKKDGEPLSRQDVQYDLLDAIFNDDRAVFTSHMPMYQTDLRIHSDDLLTFKQMYLNALLHSTKLSNTLKARMVENAQFAVEFGRLLTIHPNANC